MLNSVRVIFKNVLLTGTHSLDTSNPSTVFSKWLSLFSSLVSLASIELIKVFTKLSSWSSLSSFSSLLSITRSCCVYRWYFEWSRSTIALHSAPSCSTVRSSGCSIEALVLQLSDTECESESSKMCGGFQLYNALLTYEETFSFPCPFHCGVRHRLQLPVIRNLVRWHNLTYLKYQQASGNQDNSIPLYLPIFCTGKDRRKDQRSVLLLVMCLCRDCYRTE